MSPISQSNFVTTRWSQVLATRGDSESARLALSELCSAYYGPVVAFLTRTGCGNDDPREVAHAFFAQLLERNGLRSAEPTRGRFRSYLLGAVKHHLANWRMHQSRERRGGGEVHESMGPTNESPPEIQLPGESPQLDTLFDREWAVAVVERALSALEEEAKANGTHAQFVELKSWLCFEDPPASQAEAALRLGLNPGALKVAVHRLRRRFRELVRAEVSQTIAVGDDLEAEMHHLVESLARSSSG